MFARTIPFIIIAAAVAAVLIIDTPAASSERKERLYMCSVARLVHDLEWANDAYRESGYPEYAHAHIEDLADRLAALQAPTLHFMPPPEDCDPELADWLRRARRAGCDDASEFGRLTRRCATDAR